MLFRMYFEVIDSFWAEKYVNKKITKEIMAVFAGLNVF